ncbi:hypothetical protein B7486_55360 [cyanobacterium TDX16]|nr:hypothetical protein B7486_55360 [cyanobacterium TDX16]
MVLAATWLDLHADFAWFVVLGNATAGVWALAAQWITPLRVKALWVLTAVVEVAIFVQVALGIATMELDEIEAPEFHLFYGFVAIIAVGLIYSYRNQLKDKTYLLYGLGGLFLMGLGIRAMYLA